MVEGAPLLREYTARYRGFESLRLRQPTYFMSLIGSPWAALLLCFVGLTGEMSLRSLSFDDASILSLSGMERGIY